MALTLVQITALFSCIFSLFFVLVAAETHTVKFDNQCGYGTPQLIQGNDVLTTTEYIFNDSYSGIAYLQTGKCGFNGEYCGIIEMTLINPTVAGGGSSVDISYIPPLAYSVPFKFEYYGGCDGQGASCNSSDCSEAFYNPNETYVQVACQTDDVNLLITFCDGENSGTTSSASSSESAGMTSETALTTLTQSGTSVVSSPTAMADELSASVTTATASVSSSVSSSRQCTNRRRSPAKGLRSRAHQTHRQRTQF